MCQIINIIISFFFFFFFFFFGGRLWGGWGGGECNILACIVLSDFCFNLNLSFLFPGSPFPLHLDYYVVLSLTDL